MFELIFVLAVFAIFITIWVLIIRAIVRAIKRTTKTQVKRQSDIPKKDTDLAADVREKTIESLGEGESIGEHASHLMHSTIEGETEEEHAEHMRIADEAMKPHEAVSSRIDRAAMRRSVIMREVLDVPVALREDHLSV